MNPSLLFESADDEPLTMKSLFKSLDSTPMQVGSNTPAVGATPTLGSSHDIEDQVLANKLATQLQYYLSRATKYGAFLRTDPTEFQNLQTKYADSPGMQELTKINVEEVDGLLARYNAVLEQEPITFEEHFLHGCHALSATLLFNKYMVSPPCFKPGFKVLFDKAFAELHSAFVEAMDPAAAAAAAAYRNSLPDSPTYNFPDIPATSVPLTQRMTRVEADAYVSDHTSLMQHNFLCCDVADDPFWWRIISITINCQNATEYEVVMEGFYSNNVHDMETPELIKLLTSSQVFEA